MRPANSCQHLRNTTAIFPLSYACSRSLRIRLDYAMPEGEPVSVTPAQLSFLAIYNPTLGTTDETLGDQIVFYSSKASRLRRKPVTLNETPSGEDKDDINERLRQIGLAQGMVNFAKWVALGDVGMRSC